MGGILQIAAAGAATVATAAPAVLLRDLNANVGATGISANGKEFGDLTLKASTNAGRLAFNLDSNLAQAAIHGKGEATLSGDYPLNAELTVNNVLLSHIQPLIGESGGQPPGVEVAADAAVTVTGPVLKTDQLRGSLTMPRLQVTAGPAGRNGEIAVYPQ